MPPRVQQYQLPEVAPRPLQAPVQSGTDLGAVQVARAGADLQQAGNQLGQTLLREAALSNEARAKEIDLQFNNELRGLMFDPANGYFAKKGKDAVDGFQPTAAAIDKAKEKYLALGANPDMTRMLTDVLNRRVEMTADSMSRHATVQRAGWLAATSEARAADARNDAIAYFNDPAKLRVFLANGEQEIANAAKQQGLGDDVIGIRKKEWRSATLKGVVGQMATDDPVKAQQWFEANKDQFEGADQLRIRAQLKEAVERRDALGIANGVGSGTGTYADKVAKPESGGDYAVKPNADSGARGRYQFIRSTFVPLAREADPEGTKGLSDDQVWDLAHGNQNKAIQDKAFGLLTSKNEAALRKASLPVTDANRYLVHWFGTGVAPQLLKADPSKPIEDYLPSGRSPTGKTWAEANGIAGKTVGQVIAIAQKRMGESAAAEPGPGPEPKVNDYVARARAEAQARQGASPEFIKSVEDAAVARYSRDHALWDERRGDALKKAYDWVDANPGQPPASMPITTWMGLDRESQGKLATYVKHKGEVVTDQSKWYDLQRMATDDPQRFAKLNLLDYKPTLSAADFQEMARLQSKVRAGDPDKDLTHLRTGNEMVNEALRNLGINPNAKPGTTDEQRGNRLRRMVQEDLQAFEKQKGKKADPAEQQAIVDRLTIKLPIKGWLFDGTKQPFAFEVGDVPKDERKLIEEALRKRGLPVTDDAITSLYVRQRVREQSR